MPRLYVKIFLSSKSCREPLKQMVPHLRALFLFDPFPALAPSARQARLGLCWANAFRAYGAEITGAITASSVALAVDAWAVVSFGKPNRQCVIGCQM